jgi:putative acyl-CoA dehydrogenase
MASGPTHEVLNQPPPLEDYDLFTSDAALREGLAREGGGWAEARVQAFGAIVGQAGWFAIGRQANHFTPELRSHDRFGHRIDEVEFHPAWHEVMGLAMAHEVHALPWRHPRPGAHVARSALHSMLAQVEAGACCPITMTFACVPALRHEKAVAAEWEPRLLATEYDPRSLPADQKRSATLGMAMTEKQGGSDLRTNTTQARALGGDDEYALTGHKWFCSAPMSDAFLTLAKTGEGEITCFLVPRWRPDGTRNAIEIQRLKDKLGNRSNASSEIEYRGAWARRVGPCGRGIATILEMVQHTRLDCVAGSAGLMRQALAQAIHHASHRAAFGRRLVEQPLMRAVLADLALESEAATALALRLARAFDEAPRDAGERAFARIATAVAKYQVCKRAPQAIGEAMECLGGNGYAEDSGLPRLYREAPVNAIWEGSGNVICLDVLRAMRREADTLPALMAELRLARGADRRFDAWLARLDAELSEAGDPEPRARRLVEDLAVGLQASLLLRNAPAEVGETFCAARLDAGRGLGFGALLAGAPVAALVARAAPSQA